MILTNEFLERIANRYKGKPLFDDLRTASLKYKNTVELMEKYTELFPFRFDKDYIPSEFSDEKSTRAVTLQRNAKPHV